MSWLSSLIEGNFGQAGPLPEILGGAAVAGGALLAPELLPALGGGLDALIGGGAAAGDVAGATAAADLGITGATPEALSAFGAGIPSDLAGGSATALGPSSSLFFDPAAASSSAGLTGGFLPGVNPTAVSASGIGGAVAGAPIDALAYAPGAAAGPMQGIPASLSNLITSGASGASGAASGGGFGLGDIGSFIGKYPGVVPAAGLLAYDVAKGQSQDANIKAMTGQAGQLGASGQQLMSYLTKGTLPPGLQTAVQNATAAMKARIVSNAAANGQSTDPRTNSALAQELNQVDLNAVALIAQQGEQLMQQGLEASGLSANLYGMLEKFQVQQNQQVGQAIGAFASALAPRGATINIGGSSGRIA